jgi:hypothetical protein
MTRPTCIQRWKNLCEPKTAHDPPHAEYNASIGERMGDAFVSRANSMDAKSFASLTSIEVLKSRSRATSGTSPFSDSSFVQEVARVVRAAFKTSR